MQAVYYIKKYLLIIVLSSISFSLNAATSTSFLPMEDGLFAARSHEVVYGASIDAIKPYRQPVMMVSEHKSVLSAFGSTDILICVLLLGIYFTFTHKRSQTRNIDI